MKCHCISLVVQPVLDLGCAWYGPGRLRCVPDVPVLAALTAVALAAGWDEVVGYGVATFVAWLDVIQGVGCHAAVGAAMLPCVEDLLPESLLCTALGNERGAINLMIHAAPG